MALVNGEEPDWSFRTCVMELLSQVIGGDNSVIGAGERARRFVAGDYPDPPRRAA